MIRADSRVIVIDRMREWNMVPPDIGSKTVGKQTVKEAVEAFAAGAMLAVVRPSLATVESETEIACQWACSTHELTGVAIPEAHRAIPKKFDPMDSSHHWLQSVATEWRHFNVALWCDTQRFALLNTDIVELSRFCRLFAMTGKNDLDAVKALQGKELVEAVRECAARYDNGEPGWHIALGWNRSPPFEPVRETVATGTHNVRQASQQNGQPSPGATNPSDDGGA